MQRIRVRSGAEDVEFEGREVEASEHMADSIDPNNQFACTVRLYECPNGYRVHETIWALSPEWQNDYTLYPIVADYPAIGDVEYGTYTKEEVKEKWGRYFQSL